MAGEIKWIKVITDIFEDEKIKLIKSMPEGRTLVLIWFQLLAQAGKTNASGWIYLNEECAYTSSMLATLFNESQQMIELALRLYSTRPFEMLEITETGLIYIPNWEKHQNVESMDKIREGARLRKAKQREKQKMLIMSRDSPGTSQRNHATDIDIELEIDKEKNLKDIVDTNVSTPPKKRFIHPTLEEIKDYCEERNNRVDAEKWLDHYTANGWKVGKNAMKNWKAAVRTWEKTTVSGSSTIAREGKAAKWEGQKRPEPNYNMPTFTQEELDSMPRG